MTPPIILLFTCDLAFDQTVSEALLETGAVVLTARNVAQACSSFHNEAAN